MTSKEVGGTRLQLVLTDKGQIPLNVSRAEKTTRICANCGNPYLWAGLVIRHSKYGNYKYLHVNHWKKQNKKKKRTTCYLKVLK